MLLDSFEVCQKHDHLFNDAVLYEEKKKETICKISCKAFRCLNMNQLPVRSVLSSEVLVSNKR